ncbi:hypothetical protein VQ042_21825 [Aurantimonas sp. A2-1-M11]|uniref:hypothetical protein n=1 Tax=Aurantimonas sp. A2-1-M11 TaxID=3113712 RepID=UPI002F91E351
MKDKLNNKAPQGSIESTCSEQEVSVDFTSDTRQFRDRIGLIVSSIDGHVQKIVAKATQRMSALRIAVVLVLVGCTSSQAIEYGSLDNTKVGNWTRGGLIADGKKAACYVDTSNENSYLAFSVNASGRSIYFSYPDVDQIFANSAGQVVLKADGEIIPTSSFRHHWDSGYFTISQGRERETVDRLSRGAEIELSAGGEVRSISLRGSMKALAALDECAADVEQVANLQAKPALDYVLARTAGGSRYHAHMAATYITENNRFADLSGLRLLLADIEEPSEWLRGWQAHLLAFGQGGAVDGRAAMEAAMQAGSDKRARHVRAYLIHNGLGVEADSAEAMAELEPIITPEDWWKDSVVLAAEILRGGGPSLAPDPERAFKVIQNVHLAEPQHGTFRDLYASFIREGVGTLADPSAAADVYLSEEAGADYWEALVSVVNVLGMEARVDEIVALWKKDDPQQADWAQLGFLWTGKPSMPRDREAAMAIIDQYPGVWGFDMRRIMIAQDGTEAERRWAGNPAELAIAFGRTHAEALTGASKMSARAVLAKAKALDAWQKGDLAKAGFLLAPLEGSPLDAQGVDRPADVALMRYMAEITAEGRDDNWEDGAYLSKRIAEIWSIPSTAPALFHRRDVAASLSSLVGSARCGQALGLAIAAGVAGDSQAAGDIRVLMLAGQANAASVEGTAEAAERLFDTSLKSAARIEPAPQIPPATFDRTARACMNLPELPDDEQLKEASR